MLHCLQRLRQGSPEQSRSQICRKRRLPLTRVPTLRPGTEATGRVITVAVSGTCMRNALPHFAPAAMPSGLRSPIQAITIARSVHLGNGQGFKRPAIQEGCPLADMEQEDQRLWPEEDGLVDGMADPDHCLSATKLLLQRYQGRSAMMVSPCIIQ